MQTQRIAILVPLAVGGVAVICTIMIHALPLSATVNFVRREKRLGHVGTSFWFDTGLLREPSCTRSWLTCWRWACGPCCS